jgi:thymidylate synthase (FAD)
MQERKIKVLDRGHVTLIDCMGDDLTVVNSARVSFGNKKSELDDKDIKLINYLVKNKHDSPLRHVQIQFRVKAPEFVMRQWYKHVVGIGYTDMREVDHAWNEISGRYIKYDPEFYYPSKFRQQSKDNKQATKDKAVDNTKGARAAYNAAVSLSYNMYNQLLKLGVGKEQARCVLPVAFYTEVIWTVSLQAVLNFISLRDHEHAQWEIREYAKAVRELVEEIAPHTVKAWDKHRR